MVLHCGLVAEQINIKNMEQRYIAGDWVRYIGVASPRVVQITEEREDNLVIDFGKCNWYFATHGKVEPIPLTIELLEKNGFKQEQHQKDSNSEWVDFYHYDLGINIVYEVAKKGIPFAVYLDGKKLREIKHVHELQHVFWALGLNAELKV